MVIKKNTPKIVFCDWLGTLISVGFLSNFFLQRVKSINVEASKVNELNSEEVIVLKKMLSKHEECFIPYSWFLIKSFYKIGAKIVIVSNGVESEIIESLKIAPFNNFSLVMASDKFPPKPGVEMFKYALKKFNLKKEDAIMMGDSETDNQAAKNAGIKFYEVNDKFNVNLAVAESFGFI